MRIVIVGAYGLLGGYVTARLLQEGHDLVGVGRDITAAARRFPRVNWVRADLRRMASADWRPVLQDADAVVNCAGALQDGPRDDLDAVHRASVSALAQACAATGVRRFVQISAAGVERGQGRFGSTKRQADETLEATALDWVILRPGLVLAPAAYGGSALLRGLAGFPGVIPALTPTSPVQIISVDDVVEAVSRSLRPGAPSRIVCDLVAAEKTQLKDVLLALRAWLGLPPAPLATPPGWVGSLAAGAADGLAWLGWRSPLRTAAVAQAAAGVQGRSHDAEALLGFVPLGLDDALVRWPSGVQERWYARLYFIKPLALGSLALFWAVSGLIGLFNHAAAARLLTDAGMDRRLAEGFVLAGGLTDLALGGLVCFRREAPLALKGMILVTAAYLLGGSLWLPQLWSDPLGPLVKSLPAAVLAMAALAMMDER